MLFAWLVLNVALVIAHFINLGIMATGLQMPEFVSALVINFFVSL